METQNISYAFQAAIAPCVLISAFGLLLLSMTNRLSRPIDRLREMCGKIETCPQNDQAHYASQIEVLFTRCKLLRAAIGLATMGIFGIGVLMLLVFSGTVMGLELERMAIPLFSISLVFLLGSLIFFFMDIRLTLHSVRYEIDHAERKVDRRLKHG